MKWIKYQIVQSTVGEETILVNKKVGYSDENLAIAKKEAYNGYEIIDDEQSFEKEPLAIEFGGTSAKTAEQARENIGAAPAGVEVVNKRGTIVSANNSDDAPLLGLKLFGKTTQNGTPTPEASVELVSAGASGAINTTVCGKNLAKECVAASVKNTFEVNGDSLHIYSLQEGTNQGVRYNKILLKKGVTYTASLNTTEYVSGICRFGLRYASNNTFVSGASKTGLSTLGFHSFTYTPKEDMLAYLSILTTWSTEEMGDATFSNIQLEAGSSATEYEPAMGQTITTSTPNGLPGIPVASGGNYTDENGQQWICDYKDYSRGLYVQRIGKLIMDGANTVFKNKSQSTKTHLFYIVVNDLDLSDYNESKVYPILCSHGTSISYNDAYVRGAVGATVYKATSSSLRFSFGLTEEFDTIEKANAWLVNQYNNGTPLTFLYELAEPIETALSAEELAAYAALHSNKPNTTVYNDAGADMEVSYCTPNTAVPMNIGTGAKGKVLTVDECGHVVPKKMSASDVGARPANWMPSASDVGAAPADLKTVNAPLMSNIDLLATADDAIACPLNAVTYFRAVRPTNGPVDGGDWHVMVRRAHDSDYTRIEVVHVVNGSSYEVTKSNGTWGSWVNRSPSAFAPGGYGYGEGLVGLGNANDDAAFTAALSKQFALTANKTRQFYFTYGGGAYLGKLWNAGNNYGVLVATSYAEPNVGYRFKQMVRVCTNGTWGTWVDNSPTAFAPAEFINHAFASNGLCSNFLLVDTANQYGTGNVPQRVSVSDVTTLTNVPTGNGFPTSGAFIGHRTVDWYENNRCVVTIHEAYPSPGRTWVNHYNVSAWSGWKCINTADNPAVLVENVHYGAELPAAGTKGRLFFKVVQ